MKITSQLKEWLQSQKGVKPDATEQQYREAAAKSFVDSENPLTHDKYVELTKDADTDKGNAVKGVLDQLLEGQKAMSDRMTAMETGKKPALKSTAPVLPAASDKGGVSAYEKSFANGIGEDGSGVIVRVKGAHEQYDSTKSAKMFPDTVANSAGVSVKHPFAGRQMFEGGDKGQRPIEETSELEKALIGAFIKYSITKSNRGVAPHPRLAMTDHDHDLMQYALHESKWCGVLRSGENGGTETDGSIGLELRGQKLSPMLQKAVLDDAASGGLEAAPIFFDDMLITTPLLYSEFFPKVNVVNINRGRRIEGASMGNVTLAASTEGTAITLFNTANFIAAFDTTIFVCAGSIEIGLDFLTDSPIDVAAAVGDSYQRTMLKWLDDKVIAGNGTTEPEGVTVASGTVTVNATNGAGGPWTVGDEEALLFGVAKQFKTGYDPARIGFGANETTYRRIRGIAVGTTDQRRVFGMTHEDYRLLDRFFGINASFTNPKQVFGNWARYRMYRRMGMNVRWETAGYTLGRTNTGVMIARSRWGGHLESGSAFAVCADGQT